MPLNYFKNRRLRKALAGGDLQGLLDFLNKAEGPAFYKALAGIEEQIHQNPDRLEEPDIFDGLLELTANTSDEVGTRAWSLLYLSKNSSLINSAQKHFRSQEGDNLWEAAALYLTAVIDEFPAELRQVCQTQKCISLPLAAGLPRVKSAHDPTGAALIRLVDFFSLWRHPAIGPPLFELFYRSRFALAKPAMEDILLALLPIYGVDFVEPLLYQHGVDAVNKPLADLVDRIITNFGTAAKEKLISFVNEYRAGLLAGTFSVAERPPIFYAHQKALKLLEQIAADDEEIINLLGEIDPERQTSRNQPTRK